MRRKVPKFGFTRIQSFIYRRADKFFHSKARIYPKFIKKSGLEVLKSLTVFSPLNSIKICACDNLPRKKKEQKNY